MGGVCVYCIGWVYESLPFVEIWVLNEYGAHYINRSMKLHQNVESRHRSHGKHFFCCSRIRVYWPVT
jgi:hypothetical protein